MANYLATYTFNALEDGGAGWSENFWLQGDTALGDALARATSAAYTTARRALLHPFYRLYAVRVSDTSVRGDSLIKQYSLGEGIGLYPTPGDFPQFIHDTSEEPYDSLLIRFQSGSGARRRMFKLGGLPTEVIQHNRDYRGASIAEWNTRFQLWSNILTGSLRPLIRRRVYGDPVTVSAHTIHDDGKGFSMTPIVAVPGVTQNGYVQYQGVGAPTNLNGLYRVRIFLTATPFTITSWPRRNLLYGLSGDITQVRSVTFTYDGITVVTPVRGAAKKPGRPFGSLVGSRRRPQK